MEKERNTENRKEGIEMVTVTLRETYDLSTKQGKMTLIGIHTPRKNIIQRLWPGFVEQYKYVKILHQNVRLAAAARLPLDPLDVGANEQGQVSPEDVFNPILYKAVSNQSLSNLEYRLRGLFYTDVGMVEGESAVASRENVTGFDNEFSIYYSLLSNTRGWKTAHPQRGLSMFKLRPLVFEKWYNEGSNAQMDSVGTLGIPDDRSRGGSEPQNIIGHTPVDAMRGKAHRMPSFNTKYLTGAVTVPTDGTGSTIPNGMANGYPQNAQTQMPDIPRIYTGVILVPPSRNTVLYYRMVVETVIRFSGVQSMDEIATFGDLYSRETFPVYWNDYRDVTTKTALNVDEDTVSLSDGAEVKKIMESGA